MARSFSSAAPGDTVADFYNEASDTHFSMQQRDGRYYQARWQIGFDRKRINVEELPVDYVIGSGNHARTYLTKRPDGGLMQLPLGWYSEKGGYWAMSPGFDSLHPPSHRLISYECMACHNAYPRIAPGHDTPGAQPAYAAGIPEGIDCQRCHGPGANHVRTARSGTATTAAIRAAIVNPSRLTKERQMEVCMQCHLETTSTALPSLIRRFDRGPFAFIPGQPLSDFVLSFDHAPGKGYDDKFEIAGGAYRFRQSQCFLKSKGEMTCETCHNPHNIPRGAEASEYYAGVCRKCHAAPVDRLTAAGAHPANKDCVSCHMPKRRTDDAVHVVMTDHRIQRRAPDRDLLAARKESHPEAAEQYRGEVVPYYPLPLPATPENALYLALAQVQQGANLTAGIAQLTAALQVKPLGDFYKGLGDAWHLAGDSAKAAAAYGQAVSLEPNSARTARYLGSALRESGERARAADEIKRALQLDPNDSPAWFELGLIAGDEARSMDAIAAFRKAIALDPDRPDIRNVLAVSLIGTGNMRDAENTLRQAIRIDPYYAATHGNLARLLSDRGEFPEAVYYFGKSALLQPSGVSLYEYALGLARVQRFDDARGEAEKVVHADPNLAEAHQLLGALLARRKDMEAALVQYREAVRLKPGFSRAQLDLASGLLARGDKDEAGVHFREAVKSADPAIAQQAAKALREIAGH